MDQREMGMTYSAVKNKSIKLNKRSIEREDPSKDIIWGLSGLDSDESFFCSCLHCKWGW